MTPSFLSHQRMGQTNEYICYLGAKRMFAFETIETSLDCKCLFESTIAARVDIPVFKLSEDRTRYLHVQSHVSTAVKPPGLPFSLVFRAEPGKEDILLHIASEYEAASKRRVPPPAFAPIKVEAALA